MLQADWMDTSVGNYDTCIRRFYDISSGESMKVSEESSKIEQSGFCGE